jgi:hypothetical protein
LIFLLVLVLENEDEDEGNVIQTAMAVENIPL